MNIRNTWVICLLVIAVICANSGLSIAGGSSHSSCPTASSDVRDSLAKLAERLISLDMPDIPTEALELAKEGHVRNLSPGQDESLCRSLFEQGHSDYMDEMWSSKVGAQGEGYPVYDVGYFSADGYYYAVFVRTPTPQPSDRSKTRVVTGYNVAKIYNEKLEEIGSYSY